MKAPCHLDVFICRFECSDPTVARPGRPYVLRRDVNSGLTGPEDYVPAGGSSAERRKNTGSPQQLSGQKRIPSDVLQNLISKAPVLSIEQAQDFMQCDKWETEASATPETDNLRPSRKPRSASQP